MYDLVLIGENFKLCVEFDGSSFHPTEEETKQDGDVLLASGRTRSYQYKIDTLKRRLIEGRGFSFMKHRDDDLETNKFITEVKKVILNACVY